MRIPIALALVVVVAGLTWFGHGGRLVFAVMTCLFIVAAVAVLALGWVSPHQTHAAAPITGSASPALVAVILAFPVAMALATGTEAPATSIAQLGQLDNRGRSRFGRGTLALTIVIVGVLTMALTALAVYLHVGIPPHDSDPDRRAGLARRRGAGPVRLLPALERPAAAGRRQLVVPGRARGCSRRWRAAARGGAAAPAVLARTNKHHTPVAAVGVYAVIAAVIILIAGGQEQELVLVYAVAVFVSFLAGLLAMARFSRRRGARLADGDEPRRRGRRSPSRWSSTSPAATRCSRSAERC